MGGEAPSYGGTDVAVAVDALARTASTLQADLRSERRANEVFREGVTREQRRLRKHIEGLPLGDTELAEEGAGASVFARTRRESAERRNGSGASASRWSVTRGTSFALTLTTAAVLVLVAYAAATKAGSRGLTGGVAALSGRVAERRSATAGSADDDVPTASRLESVERDVAALRELNEQTLKRLTRTSLDPEVLLEGEGEGDVDATSALSKEVEEAAATRTADGKRRRAEGSSSDSDSSADETAAAEETTGTRGDLAFRVSLASRAASAFAEDMDVDARWTRRAASRLRERAEKMSELDEALRAWEGSSRRDPRDSLDVRAGVEAVRSWEEKIAARFVESRARAREALDVLETLETLAAEAKTRSPEDANELESLRDDLEEKRAALRLAADRDAKVSSDADAALTSLRTAILRVMAAVVDDRGEGAAGAKRAPEPSREKTLALLGAFAATASAENAETGLSMPQPALGDPEPATETDEAGVVRRDAGRESSSLGTWYTGEPSFDPYFAPAVAGSFPAGGDAFARPAAGTQVVPIAPAGYAYRPEDAATRETVAWAGDMANKLEMAQAAAEAAEEAGRAATERAADAAEAATEEARREVQAARAAEAKAKKEAAAAKKETADALRRATKARDELVSSRAEASAAQALLRNESARAMEEIQAARTAIKAESARSAAAVAAAKKAEAAIPDKVARLAKKEVDDVKKRADSRRRQERASAEAVRGEIEHEVERELADAQAKIDEAREAEAEAERRRDEALEEKNEAVREATKATRLETAAEEELARLLEVREKHKSKVVMSAKEAARMERILGDRVATAEDVSTEAGVATHERARVEARAAEAETLVRDAREDLEEATREKGALDAKIDDAAAVVRSREDDAERLEEKLRRASSEAKRAGERVRRSEKKLERVADEALDAEAKSLLDEVEHEEEQEEQEEEENEASDDEETRVEDEDEDESAVDEEEEDFAEQETSLLSEKHSAKASSSKKHSAKASSSKKHSAKASSSKKHSEKASSSKKHSEKASSKRQSGEMSSAKTNGASSSWTRDDDASGDVPADSDHLLADWRDDYEALAEGIFDDTERGDADDAWRLSDFDPASASPRASRTPSRRNRRASPDASRRHPETDETDSTDETTRVALATLGLPDVAPISFGDLERTALADVLATYLLETAPEACPKKLGVVVVGAAVPAKKRSAGSESSDAGRALASRKSLRDDATRSKRALPDVSPDDGVAVEVACEFRRGGETKTIAAALSEAPRAVASAMGDGVASGALRAAMVEAGFRVGDHVYAVEA